MPRNITLGSRLRSKVRTIRKITTKDNGKAAITRDPKDPRTRFYTKVEKNQFNLPSKIMHMTPEAHRILKDNPKLPNFLKQELSKNRIINARLETKNGIFILKAVDNIGNTNKGTFSLWYMDKNTTAHKTYFIKRYSYLNYWANAEAEFLAVKEMERLGFNIIKPEFAITDIKNGIPNIIVYDYTNLLPYPEAVIHRKISGSEILEIEKVFTKLKKLPELNNLQDFYSLPKIPAPNNNVFVKRLPNGKLKLYFTDLYWKEGTYTKREEYL